MAAGLDPKELSLVVGQVFWPVCFVAGFHQSHLFLFIGSLLNMRPYCFREPNGSTHWAMGFRHGSEDQSAQNLKIPEGKSDSTLVFYYSGSWLFSEKHDWFITEKAIVFPYREVYVSFHDVQKIYSSRGKLTIDTINGQTIGFPSKFLHAKSAAKFLHASVSSTPLCESDFKISPRSILKEMLQMLIGGAVLTIGVGYFFPDTIPWLSGIFLLVALVSPFMDENDNTSWREWSPSRQRHDQDAA